MINTCCSQTMSLSVEKPKVLRVLSVCFQSANHDIRPTAFSFFKY